MRRCRAQGTATGKYHAAVLSNDSALEAACVRAGLASGDLAHALPFAPELHFTEFTSCIADMKNSVAVPAWALTPSPRLHINESRNQMCFHSGNAGSERVSFLLHCMLWVFNPHERHELLCSLWLFFILLLTCLFSIRELSGSIPEFHQMLVSSTIIYKKIYKYSISLSSCTSSARPEPWCGRGVYIKAVWCPAGPQQRAAVVRGTVHPGAPWLRLPRQVAARRHGCACALRTYAWLLPADTGTSLSYSL